MTQSSKKTPTDNKVRVTVTLPEEKLEALRQLAAARRVPAAVLIRFGIDRVLELGEAQQLTIERTLDSMRKT